MLREIRRRFSRAVFFIHNFLTVVLQTTVDDDSLDLLVNALKKQHAQEATSGQPVSLDRRCIRVICERRAARLAEGAQRPQSTTYIIP